MPFPVAALGGEIQIPTLDGESTKAKIPAGTQPGQTVVVDNFGVPRLDGRGRGKLVAIIQIAVPNKLSSKAKSLLKELREELEPEPRARGESSDAIAQAPSVSSSICPVSSQ